MNALSKIVSLFALTLVVVFVIACGGGDAATPTKSAEPSPPPAATIPSAEPTQDQTKTVNDLATSVAVVQNPPTQVPDANAATPRPVVNLTRKFHFASLNGTLLGWQVHGDDGVQCQSFSDRYIALKVKLENTASKNYILGGGNAHVVDKDGNPPNTLGEGEVFFGAQAAGTLDIAPQSSADTTLCVDLTEDDDADSMVLVLGGEEGEQVRVPLAANGPADVGGFVEAPLNEKVTFKGADLTLPKLIVTTGVWSNQELEGQSHKGKKWLMVLTDVNVTNADNLFVEENEISLDVGGQTVPRALAFYEMYQPAPYGLAKGGHVQGAILFEVPLDTKTATLHFKALQGGSTDDVSVPLTLPEM